MVILFLSQYQSILSPRPQSVVSTTYEKEGVKKKLWFALPRKSLLDLALCHNHPNRPFLHTMPLVRSGTLLCAKAAEAPLAQRDPAHCPGAEELGRELS